MTNQTINIIIS